MDLSGVSYGQLIYYAGVILAVISGFALIIGIMVFSIKRKALKKQLTDKYGF